jgi:Ca-activated chloride channel family protein
MFLTLLKPIFLIGLVAVPLLWIVFKKISPGRLSPKEKVLFGSMRSLLLLLLVLALCDLRLLSPSYRVNLFFILDLSESINTRGRDAAMTFMKKAVSGLGKEDRAGLILFGKEASMETELKNNFYPADFRSQIDPKATNIRDALQLAIGRFGESGKNRIVLFTDGNENRKDAREAAYLAKSLGIEIFPVPLTTWFQGKEVFMEKLESPPTAAPQTPFEIRAVLSSTYDGDGEVFLLRNGRLLMNQRVTFRAGKTTIRFKDMIKDPRLYLYQAVINSPLDGIFQNNQGLSFTQGTKKTQILYLTGYREKSSHLAEALRKHGFTVVHKDPAELSESLYDLLDYTAIILHDVPSRHFSLATMENLERYVKDMGGGLVMIGGANSFGAGGYLNTPVEKTLPVSMDVPTTMEFPGFALILLIDKSASMAGNLEKTNKMEGAKIAAFSVVEMLNPLDRVGILAFDTEFQWIVPLTAARERKKIARELSTLKESGGTDLYPALQEAFRVLRGLKAYKKHVIVLSDGLTNKADFPSLLRHIREAGITVSTVSVGKDADIRLMKDMAIQGNGRSYYTDDPDRIPRLFIGETQIAAKKVIVEKTLIPRARLKSDMNMIKGIPTENLPVLQGQVITYPKERASVLLETGEGPLLSAWQYGLGRSVAFTSDLSPRWGKSWILWEHYGSFVSQMIKWAQQKETPRNYEVAMEREGGKVHFLVDVTDDRGLLANLLDLKMNILFPSGKSKLIPINQTAPGRYEGTVEDEEVGVHYLNLYSSNFDGGASGPKSFGYGIPYTDEFKEVGVNLDLLTSLAALTGGRLLDVNSPPKGIFNTDGAIKEVSSPLWPYLTLFALLLLILEVGIRKIYSTGYLGKR